MGLRIFIIQSGTYDTSNKPIYSITSKRQLESLEHLGNTVAIGLVTSRTSISGVRENIKRLKKEIKDFKPDVVHSHYGSVVGYVAHKAADGIPLVTSFCGDDLLGTPINGISWRIREFITRKFSQLTAKRSNHIIVKSPNLMDQLTTVQKNKTTVVPNGINAEFFKPTQSRMAIRKEMGWHDDQFVVFFNSSSGTNKEVKNLGLALASFKALKKNAPNVVFHQVENMLSHLFRDQLMAADCLLVTSLHEGSPNVVKEALACNIPVVTVDCGDVRLRLDGVNKGGVFPYNAEILGKELMAVAESKTAYNGRELFFLQGLDEPSIGKKLMDIYHKVKKEN